MKKTDWVVVGGAWKALEDELGPVCLAQTSANFVRLQHLMDQLVEVTAAPNAPPALFNLLDCLSDWVEAYEATHAPLERADPAQVLRHLMDANGLRQADLAQELGGQPVVSAILRGDRTINAGQASRLAQRFGVSAAIFIAVPEVIAKQGIKIKVAKPTPRQASRQARVKSPPTGSVKVEAPSTRGARSRKSG